MSDDPREEFSKESDEFLDEISNFGGSSYDLLEDVDVEDFKRLDEVEERLEKFHRSVRDDLERIGLKVMQCEEVNAELKSLLKAQPYLGSGEVPSKSLEHVRLSNGLFAEIRGVLKPLNELLGVSSRFHRAFYQYYKKTQKQLEEVPKKYLLREGECCPAERNDFEKDLTLKLREIVKKYLNIDFSNERNKNVGLYNVRNAYNKFDPLFKDLCGDHKIKLVNGLNDLKIPVTVFQWENAIRLNEPKEKYSEILEVLNAKLEDLDKNESGGGVN